MDRPSFKNVGLEREEGARKILQIEATQTTKIEMMINIHPICKKQRNIEKMDEKEKGTKKIGR